MKNIRLIFLIISYVTIADPFNSTLYAQQNAIKLNLTSIGKITLDYECEISSKNTLVVEFQRWNRSKGNNNAVPPYINLDPDESFHKTTGYRIAFVARHYRKKAMNSGFLEGGFYFGTHDFTNVISKRILGPILPNLFDLGSISVQDDQKLKYNNVLVGGIKFGLGYQKTIKNIAFEFSGGLNYNALNSVHVRPSLAFQKISPYMRFKIGLAF
jgi:hypothetical protein